MRDLHDLREFMNGTGTNGDVSVDHWRGMIQSFQTVAQLRLGETEQRNGIAGSHINLNQSNEDFLDKEGILTLRKLIAHDDIHVRVMFGDVPLYTRIKHDQSKAMCDRKLFEELTWKERIQNV